MIKIQDAYIEYLSKIEDEIKQTNINAANLVSLNNKIKKTELLIPVVGGFSSGKSTLINSFLAMDILPTNLTPETALATELRYSATDEHIEAVKEDGSVDRFEINQNDKIKERASNYQYLRMYINSDKIKRFEPLILVDMPGFDSPLDLHNQAILDYLNRGIYFVVLTSVEDGGITKSITRELRNITEFGKGFSFCLSKTNLRPTNDANDVKQRMEQQLKEEFDIATNVVLVDDNGGENLNKILTSIDSEALFEKVFLDSLKALYSEIESAINTTIATHKHTKEEVLNAIEELKQSINKITDKRDAMKREAKDRYSDISSERIISAVAKELADNQETLVNLALRDPNAFSQEANEIIKSRLIYEVRSTIESISSDVISDFSIELSSMSNSLGDFSIDDSWIEKLSETTKQVLESAQAGLIKLEDITKKKDGNLYKVITSILGITTSVVTPVLEVIIVFLPEIISFFTGKLKENNAKNEMTKRLHSEIIPRLKGELRKTIPNIFNNQVSILIESISKQFESQLKLKKQEIKTASEEKEKALIDSDNAIKELKKIKNNIQSLTTETIYEGVQQ